MIHMSSIHRQHKLLWSDDGIRLWCIPFGELVLDLFFMVSLCQKFAPGVGQVSPYSALSRVEVGLGSEFGLRPFWNRAIKWTK
jgi:hypothetical protein